MSPLARADAALLGWFQSVVDFAQRRPPVLARWCLLASTLMVALRWAVEPPTALWMVLVGLSTLILLFATYSDFVFALVAGPLWYRVTVAGYIVLLAVLTGLVLPPDPVRGLRLLDLLCMLAYIYFAACRPPKPRPPRRVASLARGAA